MSEDSLRLREIWRTMRKRCQNPRSKDWAHYGARGIRVCEEWQDFDKFYEWAMAHGYRAGLTIDRVSNNKGYNPGNCRWLSRKAQAYNRTTNTYLDVNGEVHTIEGWSARTGIPSYLIIRRMEAGWSVEDAVSKKKRRYTKGSGKQ